MASEVEETDSIPIKSTLDNATTVQYSSLLNNLVDQAKTMFKELDPTNDLTFLRIKTKVILFTQRLVIGTLVIITLIISLNRDQCNSRQTDKHTYNFILWDKNIDVSSYSYRHRSFTHK